MGTGNSDNFKLNSNGSRFNYNIRSALGIETPKEKTAVDYQSEWKKAAEKAAKERAEKADLRRTKEIRNIKNYPIDYLNYAQGYGDNYKNCVKMMIIEKQTKYPTYTEQYGDALYKLVSWINKLDITGGAGADIASNTAQLIGKGVANARISNISQNPASYWGNKAYINRFKDLFVTETEKGIITYEIPFFSDYWVETDGESGWKRPGAEMMLGKQMSSAMASIANIGFPSTPDWEFTPYYPNLKVDFHLINDTVGHLVNHLIWLNSFVTGQMYVQVDVNSLANALDEAGNSEELKNLATDQREAFSKVASAAKEILSRYTTLYKSPNVYEIIVPGRLRWLWSTISAEVTCVGKLYIPGFGKDNGTALNTGLKAYDKSVSAFPEAFKVSIDIRSLVPQAFNTYYYFLTNDQMQGTSTNTTAAAMKAWDVLKSMTTDTIELFKQVMSKIPSAGDIIMNNLDTRGKR